MSAGNPESSGAVSGLEQVVADYLRGHADFFERHGDLLASITVGHPCGRAVSLIEYQVDVLRDQNRQLRRRLEELVATARENEQLSERVHRLTLALVQCATLPEVFDTLYRALSESFGADRAMVRLLHPSGSEEVGERPELVRGDDPARGVLAPFLDAADAVCGRFTSDQVSALFGPGGAEIRSGAVLPLGEERRAGLLAIGSTDEGRYQAGMGTTFLRQLADVAGQVMTRFLTPG
jgi:hypothetical protein